MLSKKELLIICHLRDNARETLTNISKKTKIPISTIYQKLSANFNGIIKKHVALIDFSLLGYSIRANIMVSVPKSQRLALKDFLLKQFQVNSVYKVNNGFDFLIEGIFKDICEVEDFIETLEDQFQVEKTQINYLIQDLKREAFLSDPKLIEFLG
jgi:DNA-binding Lrp family transcriptional regulator